jgi:hypothetical protein
LSHRKLRRQGRPEISEQAGIRYRSNLEFLESLIRFSFKFYQPDHEEMHCRDREADYFRKLLDRIKDLSNEPIKSLTQGKTDRTTRFHPINFREERVSRDGFGIAGWEQYDDAAWQFSLSANEHGRVHGFLIENVFYVVWLDPRHRLYSND